MYVRLCINIAYIFFVLINIYAVFYLLSYFFPLLIRERGLRSPLLVTGQEMTENL
jgi:hypothetical protein